jgi:hypothetical protein
VAQVGEVGSESEPVSVMENERQKETDREL